MGTRGTNKDGGLLHRCGLESTTSAVSMLILQQLQQLLLLQRESSWFPCSASSFLLLGKLVGYVLACTHLNVKE